MLKLSRFSANELDSGNDAQLLLYSSESLFVYADEVFMRNLLSHIVTAHRLVNRCSTFLKSENGISLLLFVAGVFLISWAGSEPANAMRAVNYNDQRLVEAINAILLYLEGSFGALVMVCSGVGAILSAAFGQYRAALGLLVVAIGSFILRSFMSTFFNDVGIQG